MPVVSIGFILSPVGPQIRPPDSTPLLHPHYRDFVAHTGRSAPVPCVGTLALRFWPLVLLPWHQETGSCSSAQKPASDSRLLYAGRRSPRHQASGELVPGEVLAPGFDDIWFLNDASAIGLLTFVFRMHTCPRSYPRLFIQRSPPRLLDAAAWSGLRPAPESRSRRAHLHLLRSFTTWPSVHVKLLSMFLQHTEPEGIYLVDRAQHHRDRALDNLVLDCGDRERALPAVRLRYIHPA